MRKTLFLMALALSLGSVGCSSKNKTVQPAEVTPEMEAQQKQAEQDVRNAESANMKNNKKKERTQEQEVFEAESGRQRR